MTTGKNVQTCTVSKGFIKDKRRETFPKGFFYELQCTSRHVRFHGFQIEDPELPFDQLIFPLSRPSILTLLSVTKLENTPSTSTDIEDVNEDVES